MEAERRDQPDDGGQDLQTPIRLGVHLRRTCDPQPVAVGDNGLVRLEIDRTIFSLNAVLRAAYKFTDRFHIFLQSSSRENIWLLMLRSKNALPPTEAAAGEFANELIDQKLRESLEAQFGSLRTLIVAQAFSEGNLLDEERTEGDYNADPRGIGRTR